jgi:hypothetical protein
MALRGGSRVTFCRRTALADFNPAGFLELACFRPQSSGCSAYQIASLFAVTAVRHSAVC